MKKQYPQFKTKEEMVSWVRANRARSKGGVGRPPLDKQKLQWREIRGYRLTFVFDAGQYVRISHIANDEGLAIQEMVFQLLEEGLKRYDSGEMKIDY